MEENQETERELTLGEYRVGINFNPSQNETVKAIKEKSAELIDFLEKLNDVSKQDNLIDNKTLAEIDRLVCLSQDNIEVAAMWAVKAATKDL